MPSLIRYPLPQPPLLTGPTSQIIRPSVTAGVDYAQTVTDTIGILDAADQVADAAQTVIDPVGVGDTIDQQATGMVHRHDVLVLISA